MILSSMKLEIAGKSSDIIFIKWSPKKAVYHRNVLELTVDGRHKHEIALTTTAYNDKKKPQKKPLSRQSLFSSEKKNLYKNYVDQLSFDNVAVQSSLNNDIDMMFKDKENKDWNKENIPSRYNKTIYTLQEENRTANTHYHKPTDILSVNEPYSVWCNEPITYQALPFLNIPQDTRRATYVKETKRCNNIPCRTTEETFEGLTNRRTEETIESATCNKGDLLSDFSAMLDEIKFTSTEVSATSLRHTEKKSMEFTSLQNIEEAHGMRNKTFAVDSWTLEVPKDYDSDSIDLPSVQNATTLKTKSLESSSSFRDDISELIASSPIEPKCSNVIKKECYKRFVDQMDAISSNCEYFSYEIITEKSLQAAETAGDVYIEISPPKRHFRPKSRTKNHRIAKKTSSKQRPGKFQLVVPSTSELLKRIIYVSLYRF